MGVTIRQIRGFVAVCRYRSFTQAAAALGLTQAGLTLQIQSLESIVGDQLLERSSRSVILTPAGKSLLPIAERIIADVDLAVVRSKHARGRQGRITVAALPTLAMTLLPEPIYAFSRDHPDVIVTIRDVLTGDIIDRVGSGEAHLGLGAFVARRDDFRVTPLFRDRLVAFGLPSVLAGRGDTIQWRDLARLPIIVVERDSNIRSLIDHVFHQHNLDMVRQFEVHHLATAASLALAGLGVAILPELEAVALLAGKTARILTIVEPVVWREISVIRRKDVVPSPVATTFLRYLSEHATSRRGAVAG